MGRTRRFLTFGAWVLVAASSVVALTTAQSALAAAGLITFEETITSPDNLQTQYCNSAATNKGVEFLLPVRIVETTEGTESPTHAATNEFPSKEFEELDSMKIKFTTPQKTVTVSAGLDRTYPFEVTAHLRAYTNTTATGTPILTDSRSLGTGTTPIEQGLTVTSATANIGSIEIEFLGPAAGNAAIEWIDDLSYDMVGPLCVNDTLPPVVVITEPALDGSILQSVDGESASMLLGFVASDGTSGTGIATVKVEFRNSTGSVLESFVVCGQGVPPCDTPPSSVIRTFYTTAPKDTTAIRVTALDFTGLSGFDERKISLVTSTINLYAQSMEITQATQAWVPTNTTTRATSVPTFLYPNPPTAVPLVANRRTIVRVFAGVEGTSLTIQGVTAKLRCFTDPTYFVPCAGPAFITPEHRPTGTMRRDIQVRPTDTLDDRRRALGSSWTFLLPWDWWKKGTIYLEAEIDPPPAIPECAGCDDAANKIRVTHVGFQEVPDFDDTVHTVIMRRFVGSSGSAKVPTPNSIKLSAEALVDTYPVDPTTVLTTIPKWGYQQASNQGALEACSSVLDKMSSSFGKEKATHEVILALADAENPQLCSGLGRFNGVAVAKSGNDTAVQQEPGHGFRMWHAGPPPGHGSECTEIQGVTPCDSEWPALHGMLGGFGFDLWGFEVIPADRTECDTPGACSDGIDNDGDMKIDEECPGTPDGDPPADWDNNPHDFMSYGPCKKWISPRTWIRLFNAFTSQSLPFPRGASTSNVALANEGGTSVVSESVEPSALFVTGSADQAGVWTLEPIFELPGVTAPAELTSGTQSHEPSTLAGAHFHLELRNTAGEVVASHPFEPTFDIVHTGDPDVDIYPPPSFSVLVPLPDDFASVRVVADEAILATRTRSPNPPQVTITSPDASGFGAQPAVTWEVSDPDGEPAEVIVEFRRVGEPWVGIGTGLTGGTLPVDLADLPGGEVQIRVIASDGVNNTVVESQVFELVDRTPSAEILAPIDGDVYESGDRLQLIGLGRDPEDGGLDDASLEWRSDRDGQLGTGRRVDVESLSVGIHEITLRATDSAGQVGEAVVVVEVALRTVINIQPVADAGEDVTGPIDAPPGLDGTGSFDLNGDPITYHWSVVTKPTGAIATLSDPNLATPTLTVDAIGTYGIELRTHDGQIGSFPDLIMVEVTTPVGDLSIRALDAKVPPPDRRLIGDSAGITYEATVGYEGLSPTVGARVTADAISGPGVDVEPGSVVVDLGMASGDVLVVELSYTTTCVEPGSHLVRIAGTIEPTTPDFRDVDSDNDSLEVEFEVDCVLPVAINISPGSERNPLSRRHGVAAVVLLTTEAGEYGVPFAFDATSADVASIRFGTREEVWIGLGATEFHGEGHIEDGLELDEVTFDGDDDLVLHFQVKASSLSRGDVEACLGGERTDADGAVHSFFGCDAVVVLR